MPRNYRRVSDIDRNRIIEKYESGEDFLTTARQLGINRTTAYQIIRRYQDQDEDQERVIRTPGRNKKLSNEAIDFLVLLIDSTPTITIQEMNQTLRDIFIQEPHVCDSTITRALQCELITLKLCENVPENRNEEHVKEARARYSHDMYARHLQEDRIYIDEMGYNLYTKRTYGRAPIGQRALRIVGGQRGGNITLIAAISDGAGLVYFEIHTRGVTKDIFHNFIFNLDIILGEFNPLILMDNARCHNDIADSFPARSFKYLPPYSPFLNPIENCFSVIKARLKHLLNDVAGTCNVQQARRHGMTLQAYRQQFLITNLEMALHVVTPELCSSLYQHSNTYLMKCLNRVDIWD